MLPLGMRLTVARLLDPALVLLLVVAVGLWLTRRRAPAAGTEAVTGPAARRARVGRLLLLGGWAGIWLLSTPLVATSLIACVEMRGPDLRASLEGADRERTALVVLAGGIRGYVPEIPLRERLDASSQARVLGASRLYHQHGFGLVILTGAPGIQTEAMADFMVALGVPRERLALESASLNTRQNAANSARILRERGVTRVVVTTSASHLRRAIAEFERVGIEAIPAPVDITDHPDFEIDSLLPSAGGLGRSHVALHEILGRFKP